MPGERQQASHAGGLGVVFGPFGDQAGRFVEVGTIEGQGRPDRPGVGVADRQGIEQGRRLGPLPQPPEPLRQGQPRPAVLGVGGQRATKRVDVGLRLPTQVARHPPEAQIGEIQGALRCERLELRVEFLKPLLPGVQPDQFETGRRQPGSDRQRGGERALGVAGLMFGEFDPRGLQPRGEGRGRRRLGLRKARRARRRASPSRGRRGREPEGLATSSGRVERATRASPRSGRGGRARRRRRASRERARRMGGGGSTPPRRRLPNRTSSGWKRRAKAGRPAWLCIASARVPLSRSSLAARGGRFSFFLLGRPRSPASQQPWPSSPHPSPAS